MMDPIIQKVRYGTNQKKQYIGQINNNAPFKHQQPQKRHLTKNAPFKPQQPKNILQKSEIKEAFKLE